MSIFNKTTKEPTKQTIESVQMNAMKVSYRYKMALIALVCVVFGLVGGYFASISIITDTQAKAVSLFSQSVSKQ